jgi:hypothetical protein
MGSGDGGLSPCVMNDGTTRRLCEALNDQRCLWCNRTRSMSEPAVAFGVSLHALVGGLQIVLLKGLRGQAPAQHIAAGSQGEQWEEVTHGEREALHAHYKGSQPLQAFVHKALQDWPGTKKAPRARRPVSLPLSLKPPCCLDSVITHLCYAIAWVGKTRESSVAQVEHPASIPWATITHLDDHAPAITRHP